MNGADTEQAETAVIRLAAVFGCEAHVALSYEALILTIVNGNHFRTKIGRRLPGMNVGMAAIEALNKSSMRRQAAGSR